MKWQKRLSWLGYLLWAVFVNACNEWIVRPLLLDYAALGLVALVVIVLVWLLSIPRGTRRRWVGFTLFSLLFGHGAGQLLNHVSILTIALLVVMALGLMILTFIMTRVRWSRLLTGAIVLAVANLWLPMNFWPFLTHFRMAYHTSLAVSSTDFPAVPLEVVPSNRGTAIISLQTIKESPKDLENAAELAVDSPDALENVLRNYQHRYELVRLSKDGGHFSLKPLTPDQALSVDPLPLVTDFFPTIEAYWTVENNRVIQYMAPAAPVRTMAELATVPGGLAANLVRMGQQTEASESANWAAALQSYGTASPSAALTVQNGKLTGMWQGHEISIPVNGNQVIGIGSFTGTGLQQALIEGTNSLSVVSLSQQKVVSVFQGDVWNPLSNDIVTGPIDSTQRDVVFVNSSPAQILQPTATGDWKVLYTAPNPSLRFEASIRYGASKTPELITDDPSLMRGSQTRYFSSYTYRNGQLVRNWRVYTTNVVNVHPVQFTKNGPQYIVAGIYGSGQILVLQRHWLPVLPGTAIILTVIILAGYGTRIWGRRRVVR